MKGMEGTIHIHPDPDELYRSGAERLALLARRHIADQGAFRLALAGGTTPQGMYRILAEPPLRDEVAWERVHIYFGDERCVRPEHAESNYRMAREALLDRVPLPAAQVHRIAGEQEPEAAARAYGELLAATLPVQGSVPVFDLVLLGTGPDGHIASLFPGSDALKRRRPVTAVHVPKLDAWRVSLTFPVLNAARHLLLLLSGEKKADIIRHVVKHRHSNPLPVEMLRPRGRVEWFLDRAAARHILPARC